MGDEPQGHTRINPVSKNVKGKYDIKKEIGSVLEIRFAVKSYG